MSKNWLTLIRVDKYMRYWPCINSFVCIERRRGVNGNNRLATNGEKYF